MTFLRPKRINWKCEDCNKMIWFWQKKDYFSFCGQCYQASHKKCPIQREKSERRSKE